MIEADDFVKRVASFGCFVTADTYRATPDALLCEIVEQLTLCIVLQVVANFLRLVAHHASDLASHRTHRCPCARSLQVTMLTFGITQFDLSLHHIVGVLTHLDVECDRTKRVRTGFQT